jgi:hypothetical protein
VNLNAGVTASQTPGLAGQIETLAHTTVFSDGVGLSSNISENVDFSLSYTASYNVARNGGDANQNSNYYSHVAGLKLNLIGWRGIVLRNELTHNLVSGLAPGYDQNPFAERRPRPEAAQGPQARVAAHRLDLLDENRSTNRSVPTPTCRTLAISRSAGT